MARSWRNFFRRSKEPEQEAGSAVATEEERQVLEPEVGEPEPEAEAPAEELVEEEEDETGEEFTTPEEIPGPVEEVLETEEEVVASSEVSEATEKEATEPEEVSEEEPDSGESGDGWLGRLRSGLKRSRESVVGQLNAAVAEFRDAEDEEFWERVEEILIASDVGVTTTAKLVGELEQEALEKNVTSAGELREMMVGHAREMLEGPVEMDVSHTPTVILMVGVNGTGKTTTTGKLVQYLPGRVMLAAGDTFRAAAIEQLQSWGESTGAPVIARERGSDAAAVTHEAVEAAKQDGTDVLLIDTAGRLHTKTNLMAELEKVKRVVGRQLPGAPHEVLLTVDATTGQNGLRQAKMFKEAVGVTGIILTKLDGTARGGIALAIANEVGVPIKLISVGEKVGDLHPFDADEFAQALFGEL